MSGCPYCGHGDVIIEFSLSGGAAASPVMKCARCERKLTLENIGADDAAPGTSSPPLQAALPMPTPAAAAVPREPIPERERSEVLLAMATPDIYRRNPFRITGLRVTATAREMARQADKLKMFEKLGTPPPAATHALPLDPPPGTDAIREAMQRLGDPEKRLIDEIFWFWPLPGSPSDPALEAFESGDAKKAEELWWKDDDGPNRDVARHNLAVLHHARLLESGSDSEKEWKVVLSRWRKLVTEEALWSRIAARIRDLDDPRLTTGTVRRLRLTFPLALLSFNATIAVQAAERGDLDRAKRQRDIILASGFAQEDVDEAMSAALASVRDRLQTFCKAADADSDADPGKGAKIAKRLIEQTRPLREILSAVLPSSHPTRIGALDEVALKALGCQIVYGNKTEEWRVCADLLPKILEIAVSESARSRIEQGLNTVTTNKEATTCWFCGKGKASSEHAIDVKMYGNVQSDFNAWDNTVRTTWNHGAIPVPRCKNCKATHDRAEMPFAFGCLGAIACVLLGILVGFLKLPEYVIAILFWILIGILIGAAIWRKKILGRVKGQGAAKKHPAVRAKKLEGWAFGDAPQ